MNRIAYVMAWLDADLNVVGVDIRSEPPWLITRFGSAPFPVVVLECQDDDYQSASDAARRAYPSFAPHLAERFPLEEPSREGGVVAATEVLR